MVKMYKGWTINKMTYLFTLLLAVKKITNTNIFDKISNKESINTYEKIKYHFECNYI